MLGEAFGLNLLTLLRVSTMLVFIAAFAAILAWYYWPGQKERAERDALIPLRDDTPEDR